jgi:hypothetical protein
MSQEVLTYLQGKSTGARRDLIARCYYEVVQGDPKSAPVAFAVLLDACAEQFATTPNELRGLTSDFMAAVNAARQLEHRVIERQKRTMPASLPRSRMRPRGPASPCGKPRWRPRRPSFRPNGCMGK